MATSAVAVRRERSKTRWAQEKRGVQGADARRAKQGGKRGRQPSAAAPNLQPPRRAQADHARIKFTGAGLRRAGGRVGGRRTLVTPMIMLLTCVHAVRIDAACLPEVNQRSTLTVFPSSRIWRSIGKCERSSCSSPRGPLTVTRLHLTVTVTPSGTVTFSDFRMVFCEQARVGRSASIATQAGVCAAAQRPRLGGPDWAE